MNGSLAKTLLKEAAAVARSAYCPYSRFPVGAAVMTDDARIFRGCNVENVSFGLTVCAERAAIFSAVAAGAQRFEAMAIVAEGAAPQPCGACRQVMVEFCGPDFTIFAASLDALDAVQEFRLADLLPHPFGPDRLKQG